MLMVFDTNVNSEGVNILKKLARDERMINCNMFFKTENPSIKNFDFLKRFGTLHDLLIDLLNEKFTPFKAAKE